MRTQIGISMLTFCIGVLVARTTVIRSWRHRVEGRGSGDPCRYSLRGRGKKNRSKRIKTLLVTRHQTKTVTRIVSGPYQYDEGFVLFTAPLMDFMNARICGLVQGVPEVR